MGAGALRMPRFPASHAECCRTDAGACSSARVADLEVNPAQASGSAARCTTFSTIARATVRVVVFP